jgi:hypothetical protein
MFLAKKLTLDTCSHGSETDSQNWGPKTGMFPNLSVVPKGREMTHYWTHSHAQIARTDAAIDYLASTGVIFRRESALNLYTSHHASTFGNIKKGPSLFDGI